MQSVESILSSIPLYRPAKSRLEYRTVQFSALGAGQSCPHYSVPLTAAPPRSKRIPTRIPLSRFSLASERVEASFEKSKHPFLFSALPDPSCLRGHVIREPIDELPHRKVVETCAPIVGGADDHVPVWRGMHIHSDKAPVGSYFGVIPASYSEVGQCKTQWM